jgi:hypothetical protein
MPKIGSLYNSQMAQNQTFSKIRIKSKSSLHRDGIFLLLALRAHAFLCADYPMRGANWNHVHARGKSGFFRFTFGLYAIRN